MGNCNQVIQIVPGPQGATGQAGTNGTDGADAFTVLTAEFTMPIGGNPAGPSATATVESTAAFFSGQIIQMEIAGYLEVDTVINSTQMTLHNLQEFAPGLYPDNAAAGSIIPIGSKITPSGPQGIDGAAGTNGTNGTNGAAAFTTVLLPITMPAELATVVGDFVSTTGMIVGNNIYIQGLGYLLVTAIGSATQATIQNLEDAATLAYQTNAIAGTIAGVGNRVTAAGLQGPRGATGATGATGPTGPTGNIPYAIIQERTAPTTVATPFLSGAWRQAPLSNEISDPDGIVILAANQLLLQPGSYRFKWRLCGNSCNEFASRLANITSPANVYQGSSAYAALATPLVNFYSLGEAQLTITVPTLFELQGQCSLSGSFGTPYVTLAALYNFYSSVEIWKTA